MLILICLLWYAFITISILEAIVFRIIVSKECLQDTYRFVIDLLIFMVLKLFDFVEKAAVFYCENERVVSSDQR